jgi:hypothetical protein
MVNEQADFRSHSVIYTGASNDDYRNGNEYEILLQVMSDKRYAVFKSSKHYNESPGYRVYQTREQINQDFNFK